MWLPQVRETVGENMSSRRGRPAGSMMMMRVSGGSIVAHTSRVERHICALRNRNALVTTETELKLMAAAAMIGLSSRPKTG